MKTKRLAVEGIALAATTVLATAMLSVPAYAAPNVAGTSNQGSLMIFPRIDVENGRKTIVRIQNHSSDNVRLQCYWMNGEKLFRDFSFIVTGKQPVWFDARTGDGTAGKSGNQDVVPFPTGNGPSPVSTHPKFDDNEQGELKCWAVNNAGNQQIKFNFLSGNATVLDKVGTASGYNSWNFRVNNGGATGTPVGVAGTILLNGSQYDACPSRLSGTFAPTHAVNDLPLATQGYDRHHKGHKFFSRPEIYIVGCKQDFRQNQEFYFTKLEFDVYDAAELHITGAFHCTNSWTGENLDEIDWNWENFTKDVAGKAARFEVSGVFDPSVCYDNAYPPDPRFALLPRAGGRVRAVEATGLVGVLVEEVNVAKRQKNGMTYTEEDSIDSKQYGEIATELVGSGIANVGGLPSSATSTTGFILWRLRPPDLERAAQ